MNYGLNISFSDVHAWKGVWEKTQKDTSMKACNMLKLVLVHGFHVITAATVQAVFYWIMAPCSVVVGRYCLHPSSGLHLVWEGCSEDRICKGDRACFPSHGSECPPSLQPVYMYSHRTIPTSVLTLKTSSMLFQNVRIYVRCWTLSQLRRLCADKQKHLLVWDTAAFLVNITVYGSYNSEEDITLILGNLN